MNREIFKMAFTTPVHIPKSWGHELIIHNDELYCGKILFIRAGFCISLQHHKRKTETFFLQSGRLKCKFCPPESFVSPEDTEIVLMEPGDVKEIPVGYIHQVFALEDSTIIEFSTRHFDDDTYRLSTTF